MTVRELTEALSLTPFHLAQPDRPVSGGYAGDLLSWVLGRPDRTPPGSRSCPTRMWPPWPSWLRSPASFSPRGSPPTATCSAALRRRASICWGPGQDTFDTAARLSGALAAG